MFDCGDHRWQTCCSPRVAGNDDVRKMLQAGGRFSRRQHTTPTKARFIVDDPVLFTIAVWAVSFVVCFVFAFLFHFDTWPGFALFYFDCCGRVGCLVLPRFLFSIRVIVVADIFVSFFFEIRVGFCVVFCLGVGLGCFALVRFFFSITVLAAMFCFCVGCCWPCCFVLIFDIFDSVVTLEAQLVLQLFRVYL